MTWSAQERSGWGRALRAQAEVARPEKLSAALALAGKAPAVGRQLSYGDQALNRGGRLIETSRLDRLLDFDPATGELEVEAGAELGEILRIMTRHRWSLPVVPGTGRVSVGGAIANDVHGKNHPDAGSFGQHVAGLTLLGPEGPVDVVPGEARFAATVGGMGQTGPILAARLLLVRNGGRTMRLTRQRLPGLEAHLMALEDGPVPEFDLPADPNLASALAQDAMAGAGHGGTGPSQRRSTRESMATHRVSWIDATAQGAQLGRGILETACFEADDEADAPEPAGRWTGADGPATGAEPGEARGLRRSSLRPWADASPGAWRVPFDAPRALLSAPIVRLFNALHWRTAGAKPKTRVVSPQKVLFPLDRIAAWNRLYGKAGFYQFQAVVPEPSQVEDLLTRIAASGLASPLAVLKRLGPGRAGMMSFPHPGWTLAVDLPAGEAGRSLVRALNEMTAKAGGCVYLAKDALLTPEQARAMYPELAAWQEVVNSIDPDRRYETDLIRRLRLRQP